ncbi:acyloxyacyl hydrolase [Brumimicrobium mesophilum]|uniref:acyloxyacyl hydrolase n=1 Tax=Brumimicrobium mesophilum TaxID=392717 RepID=UPI000D142DC1|nr:acyloxyacyl hydrolase [Brumimicrobium mesophilum]
MSKLIVLVIGFGFILLSAQLSAQQQNIGLSLSSQVGYLLPHRAAMGHLNLGHVTGGQLRTVIQTNGSKQWHHDFNFPRIELNTFFYDLGNSSVLGQTFGVSSGMYLPFFNYSGWSIGSTQLLGIGWVSKHYDKVENPKNNAIGSHINAMVNLGVRVEKQWVNNSIGIEIGMTHLSNGAYKLPNLGLNLPLLSFNFTHFLNALKYEENYSELSSGLPLKNWGFYTQLVGSVKQIYPTGGSTFGIVALNNYFQYRFKPKFIFEGGIDAIYNQSVIKYNKEGHGRMKNFQMGLYAAYVLPIHKIEFLVAMGSYIVDPLNPGGKFYHKFGGRFQITDKLWGNFTIKSHWAKADYFEYGISYRWK